MLLEVLLALFEPPTNHSVLNHSICVPRNPKERITKVNNIKCPNCGFINFAQQEFCRKCNTGLHTAYQPQYYPQQYQQPYQQQYQQSYPQQGYYNQTPNYGYGYVNQNPAYNQTSEKKGFPVLKVVLGVFLGFILVSALTGGGAALLTSRGKVKWQEFRPAGADMTVMMPSEPKAKEPISTPTQMGSMTNHIYISTIPGQGTAMFCHVDLPFNINDYAEITPEKVLDGELNELLKRTNATLISKNSISLSGYSGLEFEMKPPSNLSAPIEKSFGRFYLKGNKLYLLSISARENTELSSGKEKFLNPTVNSF